MAAKLKADRDPRIDPKKGDFFWKQTMLKGRDYRIERMVLGKVARSVTFRERHTGPDARGLWVKWQFMFCSTRKFRLWAKRANLGTPPTGDTQ